MLHRRLRKPATQLFEPARWTPLFARGGFPYEALPSWADGIDASYSDHPESALVEAATPSWAGLGRSASLSLRTEVVVAPGDEVYFANNHALTNDRRVLYEPSLRFDALPLAFRRLERAEPVEGQIAYLSNTWPDNFFHFMLFTLPLLHRYEELGLQPDGYYVGRPLKSWQIEVLGLLGIGEHQLHVDAVRPTSSVVACVTRNLDGASGGGHSGWSPSGVRWLRSRLAKDAGASPSRRFYLERGTVTTRRVIGEEFLISELEQRGFERLDMGSLGMAERADLLSQASHLVVPVGAAAANLLYAPETARVLGILPGYSGHIVFDYFEKLWGLFGTDYATYTGRVHHDPSAIDLAQDIEVDRSELLPIVDAMIDEGFDHP